MRNYFLSPSPRQTQLAALVFLIFGILLCFFGAGILLDAARILGIFMVLYGGWQLYEYFIRRRSSNAAMLIQGIPLVIIGLVFAIAPRTLVSIFPIAVGFVVIFNAIVQMQKSFMLKDAKDPGWMGSFIIAVVMLLAGILLLLRPIQALSYVLRIAGVALIAEAIFMFVQSLQEQKYFRR